jgi:predicted nucleic acid-binding Zn ribbon protein
LRCRKKISEDRRFCADCEKILKSQQERFKKAQLKKAQRIMKQRAAEVRARGAGSETVEVSCVSCGESMDSSLELCPNCGAAQGPANREEETTGAMEASCMNCGAGIPRGRRLCESCMEAVASRAGRIRSLEMKIRALTVVFVCLAVISATLLVWSAFNLGSAVFIVILALAVISIGVSMGSLFMIRGRFRKHYQEMKATAEEIERNTD